MKNKEIESWKRGDLKDRPTQTPETPKGDEQKTEQDDDGVKARPFPQMEHEWNLQIKHRLKIQEQEIQDLQRKSDTWRDKCGVYMRQCDRLQIRINALELEKDKLEKSVMQGNFGEAANDLLKTNLEKTYQLVTELRQKANGNYQYLESINGKLDAYLTLMTPKT